MRQPPLIFSDLMHGPDKGPQRSVLHEFHPGGSEYFWASGEKVHRNPRDNSVFLGIPKGNPLQKG
jgi:hypothetical protein